MSFQRTFFILYVLILSITLTGCGPVGKHRVLSFFFDGVPEAGSQNRRFEEITKVIPKANHEEEQKKVKPEIVSRHDPYVERECDSCHLNKYSQKLKASGAELCFSCHDPFPEDAEVIHPPVEEGECLECHLPHVSKNNFLLVRSGQALCLECHDKEELVEVEPHDEIEDESCTECHDPHHGEEKLLK